MNSISTLRTGTTVTLNRVVGTHTKEQTVVFLGSDGDGYTIQIPGSIYDASHFRWTDQSAWISETRNGRAYVQDDADDPVLDSDRPELE